VVYNKARPEIKKNIAKKDNLSDKQKDMMVNKLVKNFLV
jgi:hypothetical protein